MPKPRHILQVLIITVLIIARKIKNTRPSSYAICFHYNLLLSFLLFIKYALFLCCFFENIPFILFYLFRVISVYFFLTDP